MLMFTLAISCLTTSNLPLFIDLTFHFPMQYYSLQPGLYFYHQSCPQLGVVFAFSPSLHSLWSISPLFSNRILGTYWPGEFIFQCRIFLPFHTIPGVLKAKILKWLAIPVDHVLSELSTMMCPSWVALHGMTHSFIELDKPYKILMPINFVCIAFQY